MFFHRVGLTNELRIWYRQTPSRQTASHEFRLDRHFLIGLLNNSGVARGH